MNDDTRRGGWTRPLRVHLGVVFVGLLLAVSVPILVIAYVRGHEAAHAAIDLEMEALAERIVDHYHITFADKFAMVQLGAGLEEMSTPPPADLEAKREYMFHVLKLADALDGIFAGYPDGRFIRMVSLREGSPWRAPLDAPAGAVAAMETIIPDADGNPTVRWTFLGEDAAPVGFLPAKPTDFDPRTRPWYQEAFETRRTVATEPYFMPLSGAYVKTVAGTHEADTGVVIAADVLMKSVSAFLHDERLSPGAEAYVFDPDGKLVVHSEPALMEELIEIADGRRSDDHAHLYEHDPLLPGVTERLQTVGSGRTEFELSGDLYEVLFVPVDFLSAFSGYTIAVVAPEKDFTVAVDRELHRGLAVAAAILALGLAAALYISRAISRSLTRLTDQAHRLREFDFAEIAPVRSRISEIVTLGSALDAARTAIRSFGLYVPNELVRRIVASGLFDHRTAVRETVTVMFTDIKDFTTISERNEPEAVVAMLSDYFELMNAGVQASDGTIIQYLGDSVYAMWNAPEPNPEHAAAACRCALALKQGVEEFNARRRDAGMPELVTRFGVHTGPAVVGNVGAEDRLQYTAMGDTINVASRLEGLNKEFGTSILVSRQTRDMCADLFEFVSIGEVRVKGRGEPVEVFEPRRKPI